MTDVPPPLPIPDVALENNASQRLPCILLIDASGSMAGAPIDELNLGIQVLADELNKDAEASQRVQLLLIRFGGDDQVDVLADWTDAMDFVPPSVTANGRSPIGAAVRIALRKLDEQKARYRSHGIAYNRPWVFLLTDGEPTDDHWEQAAAECKAAEAAEKLVFFGIGVGPQTDLGKLAQFSIRSPQRLQGLKFRELFIWLSRSATSASKASQGSSVQLAPPSDWMQVSA